MSVYHRTYTRIPLVLDVQIQFKGERLARTYTRNINSFGAFIELSKSELANHDFVGIYFTNKNNKNVSVEQKGMVIHCNKEGIGILFANVSEEFQIMLNQQISDAGTSAMEIRLACLAR